MYLRGPGTKSLGEFPQNDIEVYDFLGENFESIVPGYDYMISWKDLYSTYGDFGDFMDNIIGAYTFIGELYQVQTETYKAKDDPKKEDESDGFFSESNERARERLKFNDYVAHGELYKEWKPYKHPVYGDIEIGGWVKMSTRLSHPFMMQDLVHRNAAAVIFSSENTPEISMEVFETKKIGKNLYRVRVRLENKKALPTMSYNAVNKKIHRKDMLTLSGGNIKVVSGGQLNNKYTDQVSYKEYKPEIQFLQVPSFGNIEFQFLVTGKGNLDIGYESIKAGMIKKNVVLK
jgi:hypothetical protein